MAGVRGAERIGTNIVSVAIRVSSCGGPRLVDGQEFRVDDQVALPRTSYWDPQVDRKGLVSKSVGGNLVAPSPGVDTF